MKMEHRNSKNLSKHLKHVPLKLNSTPKSHTKDEAPDLPPIKKQYTSPTAATEKIKVALWSLTKKIFLKIYKGLSSLDLSLQDNHLSSLKAYMDHQDPDIRRLVLLIITARMKFQENFRDKWQTQFPEPNAKSSHIIISSFSNKKAEGGLISRSVNKELAFNQATLFFSANNMMQVKSFDEFELGKVVVSKNLVEVPDPKYSYIWFDLAVLKKIDESLHNNWKNGEKIFEENMARLVKPRRIKTEQGSEGQNNSPLSSSERSKPLPRHASPLQIIQRKLQNKCKVSLFLSSDKTTHIQKFRIKRQTELESPENIDSPVRQSTTSDKKGRFTPKMRKRTFSISNSANKTESPVVNLKGLQRYCITPQRGMMITKEKSLPSNVIREFSISRIQHRKKQTAEDIFQKLRSNSVNVKKIGLYTTKLKDLRKIEESVFSDKKVKLNY